MRAGHYKERYAELLALTDSRAVMAWSIVALLGLLALPLLVGPYTLSFAILILIMAVGVIGLNILTGVCGLISLGHAGFMAIGAYMTAIATVDWGLPAPFALAIAGAASAVSSLVVGVPSLRLKGLYLAITTLAFSVIVAHLILNLDTITRGSAGIFLPTAELFGYELDTPAKIYFFALATALLFLGGALNIMRTRVGRAFLAIREHDIGAQMMGVDLTRYKLTAFAVSAFYTGVSGGLYAFHVRYINVDSFTLLLSIEALGMVIVGGLGSIAGAVLGTIFMVLLPEAIRLLFEAFGAGLKDLFATRALEIRGLLYGLVIIAVLQFQPTGLIGVWREVKRIWSNWPFRY